MDTTHAEADEAARQIPRERNPKQQADQPRES
jgi:hypothetical protein